MNFIFIFTISANSGAGAAGVIFLLSYFPFFFLQPRYGSLSIVTKIVTSLFSNVAMAYGTQIIGMREGTGGYFVMNQDINKKNKLSKIYMLKKLQVSTMYDKI